MIKANELRKGVIAVDYTGVIREVTGEDIQQQHWYEEGQTGTTEAPLNPIPLTPEWLERCGFVYNAPFYTKRPLMLSKNTVRDGSGNYDGFIVRIKIEDGMQHMVIKNLHHLQNIFHSLTSEELNVKL